MIRFSIPYLSQMSINIDRLIKITDESDDREIALSLLVAQPSIVSFIGSSVFSPALRTCVQSGNDLVVSLNGFNEKLDLTRILTDFEKVNIAEQAKDFKIALNAELESLPVFLVSPKDNFDVALLIENGIGLFPPSLEQKVPEAKEDGMEAGKALAFEMPTACGFHTFRVVEAVVRRYWDFATENTKRPVPETLGKFSGELEQKNKGDQKIVESVKQLTRLHRNPLAHPDVILTNEEAIGVVGMGRSVIAAMLFVLPDVLPTTGAKPSH